MKQLNLIQISLNNIERLLEKLLQKLFYTDDNQDLNDYLDKDAVKAYFKIENSTFYRWIDSGRLKPRGERGQYRFYKKDLLALYDERKHRQRLKVLRKKK